MKYTIKVRKSEEEKWRVVVGSIECGVIEAGKLAKHFSRTYRYVKLTSFVSMLDAGLALCYAAVIQRVVV